MTLAQVLASTSASAQVLAAHTVYNAAEKLHQNVVGSAQGSSGNSRETSWKEHAQRDDSVTVYRGPWARAYQHGENTQRALTLVHQARFGRGVLNNPVHVKSNPNTKGDLVLREHRFHIGFSYRSNSVARPSAVVALAHLPALVLGGFVPIEIKDVMVDAGGGRAATRYPFVTGMRHEFSGRIILGAAQVSGTVSATGESNQRGPGTLDMIFEGGKVYLRLEKIDGNGRRAHDMIALEAIPTREPTESESRFPSIPQPPRANAPAYLVEPISLFGLFSQAAHASQVIFAPSMTYLADARVFSTD